MVGSSLIESNQAVPMSQRLCWKCQWKEREKERERKLIQTLRHDDDDDDDDEDEDEDDEDEDKDEEEDKDARTCLKTVVMVTRQLACLPACTSMLAVENCCDKSRHGNC
ncbi:hypothetical protein V1477_018706 [Vespula maculifrons]|uniref:Uncharacterized protein n=1 Tax=Vespula maculifrons TaxID=7453 RepID=A0ABD2AWJ4_VESMC